MKANGRVPAAAPINRNDPYFRFYCRFLAPNQDELTYHPDLVLPRIRDGLRGFVGMTAFEELSRQWVAEQGRAGKLSLAVQEVGSHWSLTGLPPLSGRRDARLRCTSLF